MPHFTPPPNALPSCPLCTSVSGRVVWHCAAWRVVHADSEAEKDFPVFYRLVSNAHYVEWTDIPDALRMEGMNILACVETAMREHFDPCKINLASLGNQVPHMHWHIIARFKDDSHFPNPVWGAPLRAMNEHHIQQLRNKLASFEADLRKVLLPFKDVD